MMMTFRQYFLLRLYYIFMRNNRAALKKCPEHDHVRDLLFIEFARFFLRINAQRLYVRAR